MHCTSQQHPRDTCSLAEIKACLRHSTLLLSWFHALALHQPAAVELQAAVTYAAHRGCVPCSSAGPAQHLQPAGVPAAVQGWESRLLLCRLNAMQYSTASMGMTARGAPAWSASRLQLLGPAEDVVLHTGLAGDSAALDLQLD